MLRRFHIQNFKSLLDFTLDDMGQFVCLVGLNGSGKTTVLQALDFVAHLATGGLDEWLRERNWRKGDVKSKLTNQRNIVFNVVLGLDSKDIQWVASYNTSLSRCTAEIIGIDGKTALSVEGGKLTGVWDDTINIERIEYEGSVLSAFKNFEDQGINQLKEFFLQLKSLELLSPHRMRVRSRLAEDVGLGGEKLAGYLHHLKPAQKRQLEADLKKFYPRLVSIQTKAERAGWAQLHVEEDYGKLDTDSRHINDGLLRILTLVAQVQAENQFLLFDEIENGINPELAGTLVQYLLEAKQQIMVTTHNPVILNYLPDERARESVYFLYRTAKGDTKAKRFFDLPETSQKLDVLGPGEVFLDTSLTQLSEELGRE